MSIAMKKTKGRFVGNIECPVDPILSGIALALLLFGSVMVGSASMETGARVYGNSLHLATIHHLYIVIGLISFLFVLGLPIKIWGRFSWLFLFLSIFLLVAVLIPGVGKAVNGSTRWIQIGSINLQGSELVKLFFLVYLSKYLATRKEEIQESGISFVIPVISLGLLVLLLLGQPDFGASIVLIVASATVIFLSGTPIRFFFPFAIFAFIFIMVFSVVRPYRIERIISFADPWHDPFGSGYQLTQALIAFGRGEWFGLGLGNSIQKLFFLPEAHTDFIFSIVGEELGFVGASVVVFLFFGLVIRGLSIGNLAMRQTMYFHANLAYGLSIILGVQAAINLGVNLGMLPTKGITLPLISYGGNSLVVCLVMIAILLRIEVETRNGTQKYGGSRV
ncbi:MAG: putative lipid II flippase FtsW [Gammaproteobacteria bacterium]|nr:putative lipid II flippase FtsW [Gammaproteobacteria bacterium]